MFDFEIEEYMQKLKILEMKRRRMKNTLTITITYIFIWLPIFIVLCAMHFLGNKHLLYQSIFLLVADLIIMTSAIYKLKQFDRYIEIIKYDIATNKPNKEDKTDKTELFADVLSETEISEEPFEEISKLNDDIFNDEG